MGKYTHYIKGEKEATKYAEHDLIFVSFYFILGNICIEKILEGYIPKC